LPKAPFTIPGVEHSTIAATEGEDAQQHCSCPREDIGRQQNPGDMAWEVSKVGGFTMIYQFSMKIILPITMLYHDLPI
jgi:hypothetical protein